MKLDEVGVPRTSNYEIPVIRANEQDWQRLPPPPVLRLRVRTRKKREHKP